VYLLLNNRIAREGEEDLAPKAENKVDLKRVFMAPISVNKELTCVPQARPARRF
jgi:hypothetical protein